jgi:hypothetical protein
MKLFFSFLFLLASTLLIIYPDYFSLKGLEYGFSWTLSMLSHWLLIALTSSLSVLICPLSFKRSFLLKLLVPLVFLGIYFAVRPIYEADYVKRDTALEIKEHSVLTTILNKNPNYNGVVCIAMTGCGYCKIATRNYLNRLKERNKGIDVGVLLTTTDSSAIDYYISETNAGELDYFLMDNNEKASHEINELTKGRFPSFIYIKNSTILHKWSNDNLGFPALDWIENQLE